MRILIVSNYYPPYEVGGYEQLCRDIALLLSERGHQVTVLTSTHGLVPGRVAREPGVMRELTILPQSKSRLGPALQFFTIRRKVEQRNRDVFRTAVGTTSPDAVFIWNLQGLPYEIAVDAEQYEQIAVAYWLAGYTPAEPDMFWRYWTQNPGKRTQFTRAKAWLGRIAFRQMQREGRPVHPEMRHVGVVSEYMRTKGRMENTVPEHAEVIYNGVETDRFYRPVPSSETCSTTTIIVAGRVSEDKGVHTVLNAIIQLARKRPERDFRLIVAGSGPASYIQSLQHIADHGGVRDLVSFTGWLPRNEMSVLLTTGQILVLAAVYPEAFSRVVLEGMAAGLAVVATLTGGTGELVVNGYNGLTFATEDSVGLATQLDRLISDSDLRHRIATTGQETVMADFSMSKMADRIEDMLQRAVSNRTCSS